jgi:hypothetical protein
MLRVCLARSFSLGMSAVFGFAHCWAAVYWLRLGGHGLSAVVSVGLALVPVVVTRLVWSKGSLLNSAGGTLAVLSIVPLVLFGH